MFLRQKTTGRHTYLQIVENYRDGARVRQRVVGTLGRIEDLQGDGTLDALLASAGRFAQRLLVLSADARGEATRVESRRLGPSLVFERLWAETGCRQILDSLLARREFGFAVERAVFLTVLHRLFDPGSDRQADRWRHAYRIQGTDDLELHHLYRAMAWLGEALPAGEAQKGKTPFVPRCVKDQIEEALFARRQTLFTSLDLVFFDTTSIYFEGEGGDSLGAYGKSKDHRPDRKQMVVGAVLDGEGNPLCCEMWPGNVTDVTTLIPVADRLRKRFGVRQVCIVADAGMISASTIKRLERRGWKYILAARMRSVTEVAEKVLGRAGRFHEIHPPRQTSKDPSPLKVKEVEVDGHRYVVCLNEDEAAKDAADRQAIVESLEKQLAEKGPKALVGNKGYRRFLDTSQASFAIDRKKIEAEARFDGKWVLRTNTDLPRDEVALKYKQLLLVEEMHRTMKSILETRPIWHKTDETIRGHVFCSFLALVLRKAIEDKLEAAKVRLEWHDIIRDLDLLGETEVEHEGKRFLLRDEVRGVAGKVCQAVGVALPPTIRQLPPVGPPPNPEASPPPTGEQASARSANA